MHPLSVLFCKTKNGAILKSAIIKPSKSYLFYNEGENIFIIDIL